MLSSGNGPQVIATPPYIAIGLLHLASITQITRSRADSGRHLPGETVGRPGREQAIPEPLTLARDRPTAEQHFELRYPALPVLET